MKSSQSGGLGRPAAVADPLGAWERASLVFLAAAWVGAPWMLGSSVAWAQLVAGTLALGAAGCAWLGRRANRADEAAGAGGRWARLAMAGGVAFLVYVTVQALHPTHQFMAGWPVGTVKPMPHIGAIPGSIEVARDWPPGRGLTQLHPWQRVVQAATILGLGLAVAWSLRRPRAIRRAGEVLMVHAAVFSAYAFWHAWQGNDLTLGFYHDGFHLVRGPQFPYRNQQAAYQTLLVGLVLALALARGHVAVFAGSRWRGVVLGLATLVTLAAGMATTSRAGILGTLVLAVVAAVLHLRRFRRGGGSLRRWLAVALPLAAVAGGMVSVLPNVRFALSRFDELFRADHRFLAVVGHRALVQRVGWEMFLDQPIYGWGAGSFIYLFEDYHPRVPEYAEMVLARQPQLQRLYWLHPDGDYVELLVEHGAVGVSFIALAAGGWLMMGWQRRSKWDAASILISTTVGVTALHGLVDYVMRNVAVSGLTVSLAVLVVKMLDASQGSMSAAPTSQAPEGGRAALPVG